MFAKESLAKGSEVKDGEKGTLDMLAGTEAKRAVVLLDFCIVLLRTEGRLVARETWDCRPLELEAD